jgi:RNA polymerase sigma-70 factor (ECF subfamily)
MEQAGNRIARSPVLHRMGRSSGPELRIVPREHSAEPMRRAASATPLSIIDNRDEFQRRFLPHLDAAYNLARWILKNEADAEDAVQDAFLRALRFREGYRGGDARAWLLAIVRNAAYTLASRRRTLDSQMEIDEELHASAAPAIDVALIRKMESRALRAAMETLPAEFREIIVLRDLEGFSYREIAEIADLPIGTVMSRLARARMRLKEAIARRCEATS